jgi:hypothetical protein
MTLPRSAQASSTAKPKCRPKKGVKEAITPQETPKAKRCGVSGRRRIRCPFYSIARRQPLRGRIASRIWPAMEGLSRRLKTMNPDRRGRTYALAGTALSAPR